MKTIQHNKARAIAIITIVVVLALSLFANNYQITEQEKAIRKINQMADIILLQDVKISLYDGIRRHGHQLDADQFQMILRYIDLLDELINEYKNKCEEKKLPNKSIPDLQKMEPKTKGIL